MKRPLKSQRTELRDAERDPLLKLLQRFSYGYLPHVEVKWGVSRRGAYGRPNLKTKKIYLRSDLPLDLGESLNVGGGHVIWYDNRWGKLKLVEGEQYFLVLLHEIGHFGLVGGLPRRVFFAVGFDRVFRRRDKLEKWPREMLEKYFGKRDREKRIRHSLVHEWAIYQFRKRRREIRTRLSHIAQTPESGRVKLRLLE